MKIHYLACLLFSAIISLGATAAEPSSYIDPAIGSEGLGRVYIGPATPFGMVRPGPDCTPSPNSGWLPMPVRVDGFAQTHVSGTGGGPKYGNILVQPFIGDFSQNFRHAHRSDETIEPGYYATTYEGSGITTEITTAPRASVYRISYPGTKYSAGEHPSLLIDCGFFLGYTPTPDAREAQQFVGSEVEIKGDNAVQGYSRIRGGWNNGRDYTVYFYAETDRPFVRTSTWADSVISPATAQPDNGLKTGALLAFADTTRSVNLRIGISFLSQLKAKQNLENETRGLSFEQVRQNLLDEWNAVLNRVELAGDTPENLKRMFYTGLYHTMLMPSDRTGENPRWNDPEVPYYDDFYALWDTYRTSTPLMAILIPDRLADIVNSLVNIGKRDGYMPDSRSGNCNGRTQGGSNADVVVADAFVKGIGGIDYEAALAEMLKDGEIDPGYDHEAHGRGGLNEYKSLGYIPHGIARAGNRTVEYSLCDFAIAQVARGLGKDSIAVRYDTRSHYWKNLWRNDFRHDGAQGFIMPRAADGSWLDSIPFGHSGCQKPTFRYHPLMFEGPWYTPWWNQFFYEASSWEYSLSMPHDVPMLIEACGGPEAFNRRLDTFFERNYYNVNNEPSFMTPLLYHWIGRPDKSTDRIRRIVTDHFNDSAAGLPGNDDSGAMSSWLAFNILGLYPNAGHDYYLINSPMTSESKINLPAGKSFVIKAKGLSDKKHYISSATLNGKPHPWSTLKHSDLMAGGELVLTMGDRPGKWGRRMFADSENPVVEDSKTVLPPAPVTPVPDTSAFTDTLATVRTTFFLHGQKRRFDMTFTRSADGAVLLSWGIERNLKYWRGTYIMPSDAVRNASGLCYTMPEDGNHIVLLGSELFCMLSQAQMESIRTRRSVEINGVRFTVSKEDSGITTLTSSEGACLEVATTAPVPLIISMTGNPLEIDWKMEKTSWGGRLLQK